MNDTVLRLLIVDDDPVCREMLLHMLASSKSRFQIIEAETGAAALTICQENPPDCVLLDYHLPDFEARYFLAELGGSELPKCPVVIITGLTEGLSGPEIIRLGAQDFIGKSWINQESLQRAIENAIERYKMLCKLRDKKQLFSTSQRNAHIGSWASYRDKDSDWSDEAYRLWGVSPDSFTANFQALESLVYPEDWPALSAWMTACLAGESPPKIVTRRLMPDGNLRYLCSQAELNTDASRKNLLLEGTVQDVTEHTLAQIQLKGSEERLRLALDAARLGIFDWDMVLNRIVWSRQHEELWGFKPGEFDGSYAHFASRVHTDDRQSVEDEVIRCIATHEPFKQQYRVVRLDGTEIWVSGVAEIYFDAAEQALRMTGAVEDITERKRSEALLLEAETTRIAAHYARNLIETNLDPLVTLSSDGKITDANAAAEAAFECAKSELIGSDFAGYFTKPDAAIALYQQVFNTGTVHNHALDIHHPEGQATPVLYNATLYRDDAGVVLGAVAVARDISDLVLIGKDLKMSESHFKALFNEAPLGIAVIDSLTGRLLSANPMYAKISGKTLEELVTIDWMSITHPDDVQKDLDNMALMNSGQIPGYQLEKRYYQPGGA
ncbi:MAG: PAS domain S-box protein, partial [Methylococcaceae bacterium]